MKIFLLLGQSNMAGRAPYTSKDDEPLKGTFLLNEQDEWEEATNPLNKYSTVKWCMTPGMNPGVTFAEAMKVSFPKEKIGLICNARGASKISEWQKEGHYYNEAVRRTKNGCKNGEKLAGILWLQGEQDTPDPADYDVKLKQFITDIRDDLGGQDIPFIAGEIMKDLYDETRWSVKGIEEINRQTAEVVSQLTNCALISGSGLDHMPGDEVHIGHEGVRILGKRYAEKYLEKWNV